MSITITIEGNHPTDVLAQLQQLAAGLSNQQLPAPVAVNKEEKIIHTSQAVGPNDCIIINDGYEKPKKLTGKEHKTEADKMIAAGKIDDVIFPLLSKNQQERVEAALNNNELDAFDNMPTEVNELPTPKKAPTEDKKDVGGLFDDEAEDEQVKEINIDDLRDLITKKCKDKNGKDIPEMYSAVRAEIKNVVPKDKEPKVSEVPAEKYAELYEAIKSLGA